MSELRIFSYLPNPRPPCQPAWLLASEASRRLGADSVAALKSALRKLRD